ncbi:MAG TPA: exosortase/archaeosortase family protein [Verrucomicrobiae bacterium]|nr:exosortase/archaeosortase family protein [Verrucomicrobiae bacterium]
MESEEKRPGPAPQKAGSLGEQCVALWRSIPHARLFLLLFGSWVALFHFLGNSTLGYVSTPSLFGWWQWTNSRTPEEAHIVFVPLVSAFLLWHRRQDFQAIQSRIWWPGIVVLLAGIGFHVIGYTIQQARVSVVGFIGGIYGIGAVLWGPRWMRAALIPFVLFGFCVPLGSGAEPLTFPLRLLATDIGAAVCRTGLGIDVVQQGNLLLDSAGAYRYEVAAACSGIQSLTAVLALALIYAGLNGMSIFRTGLLVAAGIPLAIVANVVRLLMIVMAAEVYGQSAGDYVHRSGIFSMVPYIPAIAGLLFVGRLLKGRGGPDVESTTGNRLGEVPG